MPIEIKLSKPLATHGGNVNHLTMRDLTAKEMIANKVSPIKITLVPLSNDPNDKRPHERRIETDMGAAAKYISDLTGIDTLTVETLPAKDFNKLLNALSTMWSETSD